LLVRLGPIEEADVEELLTLNGTWRLAYVFLSGKKRRACLQVDTCCTSRDTRAAKEIAICATNALRNQLLQRVLEKAAARLQMPDGPEGGAE